MNLLQANTNLSELDTIMCTDKTNGSTIRVIHKAMHAILSRTVHVPISRKLISLTTSVLIPATTTNPSGLRHTRYFFAQTYLAKKGLFDTIHTTKVPSLLPLTAESVELKTATDHRCWAPVAGPVSLNICLKRHAHHESIYRAIGTTGDYEW